MDPRSGPRSAARNGIPRTRGDGPRRVDADVRAGPDSPHPRGWTLRRLRARHADLGFPAPAGMDRASRNGASGGRGIPRTRGDGPAPDGLLLRLRADSPHPRGWTLFDAPDAWYRAGFPAPAGMDPAIHALIARDLRIPRTRGDGPLLGVDLCRAVGDSPHPRGWTVDRLQVLDRIAGFPAPAGMDPAPPGGCVPSRRIPRTRGDGPGNGAKAAAATKDSPHPRGWTQERAVAGVDAPGFPAPAGMDRCRARRRPGTPWIPRTRGDGPGSAELHRPIVEDSPHPRGWTPTTKVATPTSTGFPAPAGMDPRCALGGLDGTRIPRTRGDGPHIGSRP